MEQKNQENVLMEKKIFIFALFLLAALITSSVFLSYFLLNNKIVEMNNKDISSNIDIPVYENIDKEPAKETKIYMLKEYNGKIGVYENEALVYTLDTYVFTLPDADKQLLKRGIITADEAELYELIESYY